MPTAVTEPGKQPRNSRESGKSQGKAVVIVGLICVGVLAAVVAMNFDVLSAGEAEPGPTGQPVATTPAPNTLPVIVSVTPASDRIEPSDLAQVVCEAEDADGDALTYTWTASQGDIIGEGEAIEWAAPEAEGLYRLSVTADDGRGGAAEYSVSLRVKSNYAPEIVELSSFSDWVMPGMSTYLTCSATDLDGDAVTYEWKAAAGELFGEGHSVVWAAPETPGPYTVAVVVRDSYGAEAMREIPISVTPGTAPTLGRFRVKGVMTDMLKLYNDVWEIFMGRSCSIECNVTDGEGPFTYAWSVDRGKLTANGAMAQWDAPESKGPATVTVNVTDVHGNTTVGTVMMFVETCTCKFN